MNQRIALTVLTALFCGLVQQTFSQQNYQPGYVISTQGDTLKGYIDYRNWERNPKKIAFSKTPDGPRQEFRPLEIRSFLVSGDLYEGAIVNVETSAYLTDRLDHGPALNLKTDTAFMRALVTGEKSLYTYHYTDELVSKDLFYIREGGRLELLQFKMYLRDHNGARTMVPVNFYLNQLALYLNGCSTIRNKLERMKYDSRHLKKLFDDYYACTQTQVKFAEKKEKYPLEIGVLLGGTRTQIEFQSAFGMSDVYLTGQSFSPDFNFTGGFFFDLIRPRNNRKWSFNNELMYTSYKAERTYYSGPRSADSYNYYYTELKYSYVKLNSMVRFKYPIGQAYIFADAGVSNGYMLSGSDYRKEVTKYASLDNVSVYPGRAFTNGVRKYEFGFLGGLGVRYRRYAFEGRYDSSSGMLDYIELQASVTKLSVLLSYRFTK